jgi:hypothetical protein
MMAHGGEHHTAGHGVQRDLKSTSTVRQPVSTPMPARTSRPTTSMPSRQAEIESKWHHVRAGGNCQEACHADDDFFDSNQAYTLAIRLAAHEKPADEERQRKRQCC